MRMKHNHVRGVLWVALALLIVGCTTQKKKGDMSAFGKAWHDTNAHYNGYFNAKELLDAAVVQLEDQYVDNYNSRLAMYEYIAADNAKAVADDMDKAAEKVGLVVNKHKYSKWVDDCYLLLGQAQFLKKDYESAEETFRYLGAEYTPEKIEEQEKKVSKKKKKGSSKKKSSAKKKKKKKTSKKAQQRKRKAAQKKKRKGKTSSSKSKQSKETEAKVEEAVKETEAATESSAKEGAFVHEVAWFEGQLWLAKTLIERDKMLEANRILRALAENPKTIQSVKDELVAVQAYWELEEGDLAQAVGYLEKAVEVTKSKKLKARYAFIMGQAYRSLGNTDAALAAFERANKFSPDYEMQFSSKLEIVQNDWLAGRESADVVVTKLEKMLKDPKNEVFKDQVYYALANIALKEGDTKQAIVYLTESLKSNSGNSAQKADTYYQLGRLFFNNGDYVQSYEYYNQALGLMGDSDNRKDKVKWEVERLKDIADNVATITTNDSLLVLGQMSDEERRELAFKLKKEELEKKLAAQQASATTVRPGGGPAISGGKSNFFAYNDRAVKKGRRTFQENWGNRTLEDNWRLSAKGGFGDDEIESVDDLAADALTEEEIKKLLGNIPQTKAEIAKLENEVQQAMLALGKLYKDRLKDNKKSIDILTQMEERFAKTTYEAEMWYLLYWLHTDESNTAMAKNYYDKLVGKYPKSNYALILSDPSFAAKFNNETKIENLAYDETYKLFKVGEYSKAMSESQRLSKELLGKHPLKPKYALLMAMCTGSIQGKEHYIQELQKVVASYPGTAEQKRAKEILRVLGVAGANLPGGDEEDKKETDFEFEKDALHYIIVIFEENVKLNEQKAVVANYNRQYHKLDRLRISNVYIGEKHDQPVLVLRRFANKDKAMDYYDGIKKNAADYIPTKIAYKVYPITQGNYRKVLKASSVAGYDTFFEDNYK